jgi:hypothetical protein
METPNLKKAMAPICQKAREPRINRKDCKILISGGDEEEKTRLSGFLFFSPKINSSALSDLKAGVCSELILSGALDPALKGGVWRCRSIKKVRKARMVVIPPAMMKVILHPIVEVK